MQQIVILGGGAAGLAAALAAAQSAPAGAVRVTVLDRNPRCGKKLLATGNGRCNLDNTGIAPEQYFTADPAALRPLLAAVDAAAPLEWFAALGLYTRTDEAGRVYPYSNQAADVLTLLEGHLARLGVEVRTGCTVQTLSQNRSGYTILCENAEGQDQTLRADAVICAMPDRPADNKAQPVSGRHPGQGRCHPAGPRPPLHRGCGKRRGAVHGLRAFGHLHHAAVRPSGPGAGAKAPGR